MNETGTQLLSYVFCLISGYLMGTVNLAWLLSKQQGFDIRSKGSGNAGTTNAGRTMGLWAAAAVLVFDVCKSAAMTWMAGSLFSSVPGIRVVMAAACILGHMYPFYLELRGGKGIAVALGSALALDWRVFLVLIAAAVLLIVVTDYMFISTLTIMTGYFIWFVLSGHSVFECVVVGALVALMFWKHRPNFKRYAEGKELGLRATFFSGKMVEKKKAK